MEIAAVIGKFAHYLICKLSCGSSSVGRATAFQAVGRGFEPRLPLRKSQMSQISQISQTSQMGQICQAGQNCNELD